MNEFRWEGFRYSIELTVRQDAPQSNRKIPLNSDPSQTLHPRSLRGSFRADSRIRRGRNNNDWGICDSNVLVGNQRQDSCHSDVHGSLACDAHRWRLHYASPFVSFSPSLSLSYSLLGAIVESRFESRYPRQQPGVKRTRLGFTLGGRWTSVETASALLLRSTLTTADALRRKWGGFRAMETLASLDYVRGGARLRDDDGMNRCECVSLCRRRVAWEW